MTTVTAPYHFVPLSKWVYMPDWAHIVSHDVPFEDGVSGVIDYHLTNHTPLCVGDTKDAQNVLRSHRLLGHSRAAAVRSLRLPVQGTVGVVGRMPFSHRERPVENA